MESNEEKTIRRSLILKDNKVGVYFLENLITINKNLSSAFTFTDLDGDRKEVSFYVSEEENRYLGIVLDALSSISLESYTLSLKDVFGYVQGVDSHIKDDPTIAQILSMYVYIIRILRKGEDRPRLKTWDALTEFCDEQNRKDLKKMVVDSYYGQFLYKDDNEEHLSLARLFSSALYFFWDYSNLISGGNNSNKEIEAREFSSCYETIMKIIFWLLYY